MCALALSGTVAGLLSGLLGVGGGFVMGPALQRYTDLVMRSVVATSLAVIDLYVHRLGSKRTIFGDTGERITSN